MSEPPRIIMDCYGLEDFVGLSPPDVWGVPEMCAGDERGEEDNFTNFNNSRDFHDYAAQSETQIFHCKNDYKTCVETVEPSLTFVLDGGLGLGGNCARYNTNNVDGASVGMNAPRTISGGFGTTTICGTVFGNNYVDQDMGQNRWGYGQPGLNAEMVGNFGTTAEANTDFIQLGDSFEWLETGVDVGKMMSGTQTTQQHSGIDEFQSADVFIKHIVDECNEFEKKVRTSTGNFAPRGLPPTPASRPSMVTKSSPIPVPPSCKFSGDSGLFNGMSTPSTDYVPNGHYSPDLVTMEPVVFSPVQVGREIEVASAAVPQMLLASPPSGKGYRSFEMGTNPCPNDESAWLPSQMSGYGIGLSDPSLPPTSPKSEDIIGSTSPIVPHGAKHLLSIPIDGNIALTPGTIIHVTVSNGAYIAGRVDVQPAVQHDKVFQKIQPNFLVMGANNPADGAGSRSGGLGCEDVLPMAVNHLGEVVAGGAIDSASRNAHTNLVINRGLFETQLVQMVEEVQDVASFANNHHPQMWNSEECNAAQRQQSCEIVDVEDGGMINVVEEVVNTSNVVNGNYQAAAVCDGASSIVGGQELSGAHTVGIPTHDYQKYVVNHARDDNASTLSVQRRRKLLPAPPKKSGGGKAGSFLEVVNPSASQELNERSSSSLSSSSSAGTLGKVYARGARPYPVQREIKKQQNREAACRYRMKQKAQKNGSFSELDSLEGRNCELKGKVEELEREVSYLKNLMVELRQMKE